MYCRCEVLTQFLTPSRHPCAQVYAVRQAEAIARAKLERERLGLRSAQRRQRAARVLLAARRELGIDKQVVSSRFMEGVEQKAAEGRELVAVMAAAERRRRERYGIADPADELAEKGKAATTPRKTPTGPGVIEVKPHPYDGPVGGAGRVTSREAYLHWKRRQGLAEEQPVFIMTGGYEDVRVALFRRGWKENPNAESPHFDLLWSLKAKDVDHKRLRDDQVVNHFEGSAAALTTKRGLCETLRGAAWCAADADPAAFYPRCYNLYAHEALAEFRDDFAHGAAVAVLQSALAEGATFKPAAETLKREAQAVQQRPGTRGGGGGRRGQSRRGPRSVDFGCPESLLPPAEAAADICSIDVKAKDVSSRPETANEGASLRSSGGTGSYASRHVCRTRAPRPEALAAALRVCRGVVAFAQHLRSDGDGESSDAASGATPASALPVAALEALLGWPLEGDCVRVGDAASDEATQAGGNEGDLDCGSLVPLSDKERAECESLLAVMRAQSKQSMLDGPGNVWIVKPGGKSRGRGIRCFNRLAEIETYVNASNPEMADDHYVAQKYIEAPLIIRPPGASPGSPGRKFDIRQWVMVTCWNPLTVWFAKECYFRFCAEDYDVGDLEASLRNNFIHLSNNSIAKYSDVFESNNLGEGNMWSVADFKAHLAVTRGSDADWDSSIAPAMRTAAVTAMKCAVERVSGRANTAQVYGLDFMVDDALNVWLIEVNSSPSMEHSTPITSRLCAAVAEDTFKVLLDSGMFKPGGDDHSTRAATSRATASSPSLSPSSSPSSSSNDPGNAKDAPCRLGMTNVSVAPTTKVETDTDTGLWELVFKGSEAPRPSYFTSVDLTVKGVPVSTPASAPMTRPRASRRRKAAKAARAGGKGRRGKLAPPGPRLELEAVGALKLDGSSASQANSWATARPPPVPAAH